MQAKLLNAGPPCIHTVILETGEEAVSVLTRFAADEPAGPYRDVVPARRTLRLRFNDLKDPEQIPLGTDYSSVIESDVPIVAQRTRLASRRAGLALLSTIAYPA